MSRLSDVNTAISIIAGALTIISAIYGYYRSKIPKPVLRFNNYWNLIEIENISHVPIYIVCIKGRHGKVADCSWETTVCNWNGKPDWKRKYTTDFKILPGETEEICFGFEGGFNFKMSVKRASILKSNEFFLVLSR